MANQRESSHNSPGTLLSEMWFRNMLKEACKGTWYIERLDNSFSDDDFGARCSKCGDEIHGVDNIVNMVKPGYHCWCDR